MVIKKNYQFGKDCGIITSLPYGRRGNVGGLLSEVVQGY
jgi:hypothetical protein